PAPRRPAQPRPARSASCPGPAAPAARQGPPETPAAAPNGRTDHQTGPHTPPAGPAPQDTPRVASSRAPRNSAPPSRIYHQSVVNKLPLVARRCLSLLYVRVQVAQLDSCVVGVELPVDLTLV